MPDDHDIGYKLLFAHPELVHALLRDFAACDWVAGVGVDGFERVNSEYASERFSGRRDDLVWRIRLRDGWLYVYLLLELQSGVDRWMALRMQVYTGLLYQDLVRRGELSPDGKLPAVLPLVFYNGHAPWHAAHELTGMIVAVPDGLAQFLPAQRYCLIDQRRLDLDVLEKNGDVLALLFRLELADAPKVLNDVVAALSASYLQDAQSPLRRSVSLWVRREFQRKAEKQGLPHLRLEEGSTMSDGKQFTDFGEMLVYHGRQQGLEEGRAIGMAEGKLAGIAEGKAEGKAEGERAALVRIVERRFGSVPPAIRRLIAQAPLHATQAWLDRAVEAASLEAVFAEEPAGP